MALSSGWTWDYVAWHIDLPRLATLNKYWDKSPPIHILMKAYVGYKPDSVVTVTADPEKPDSGNKKEMAQFMAMVPKRTFPKPVSTNGDQRGSEPIPES